MEVIEVAELFKIIKRHYPSFDASVENVKSSHKYLRDFPFQAACQNVDQHILTERFPPTIADIRGRLGEQIERQRMKDEAESYSAQVELWKANCSPPPAGYFDTVRAKIRGVTA